MASYRSTGLQAISMGRSLCLAMIIIFAHVQGGMAQDVCFCLRDRYDNWLRDCREIKSGIAPAKILCHGPKLAASEYRTQVPSLTDWTRVEEGQEGCSPCAYQLPIEQGDGPPRGGDNAHQKAPSKEKPDGNP